MRRRRQFLLQSGIVPVARLQKIPANRRLCLRQHRQGFNRSVVLPHRAIGFQHRVIGIGRGAQPGAGLQRKGRRGVEGVWQIGQSVIDPGDQRLHTPWVHEPGNLGQPVHQVQQWVDLHRLALSMPA